MSLICKFYHINYLNKCEDIDNKCMYIYKSRILKYFLILYLLHNMPFLKKQVFVLFHSVDLFTEYRIWFFEENWILKVKAVHENIDK